MELGAAMLQAMRRVGRLQFGLEAGGNEFVPRRCCLAPGCGMVLPRSKMQDWGLLEVEQPQVCVEQPVSPFGAV